MGTIKIFCCLICFAVAGRNWGNDSSIIRKESGYEKVIGIARKEIGVREEAAENSGARVSVYLEYVGLKSPAPWCAAFVSYCFGKAGYAKPRTAWSPLLFPASRLVKEAKPGIVYGIYYKSLSRIGHCGIVFNIRNSWITGGEGNTNPEGSREGQGVYERIRHVRTISHFADWIRE